MCALVLIVLGGAFIHLWLAAGRRDSQPGIVAYKHKDYNKAISELSMYIGHHPDHSEVALYYRGLSHLKLRQYNLAVQDLQAYSQSAQGDSEAHYSLGQALFEDGDLRGARKQFTAAISWESENRWKDQNLISRSAAMIERIDKLR